MENLMLGQIHKQPKRISDELLNVYGFVNTIKAQQTILKKDPKTNNLTVVVEGKTYILKPEA